jgi:predicted Zn-dependent peptidases
VNEAMLYFKKVNAERKSKNLKSTSYWLDKMRAEYFDGVDLDKDNEALFTSVTPDAVRRLAREIFAQGNRYTAVFTQE